MHGLSLLWEQTSQLIVLPTSWVVIEMEDQQWHQSGKNNTTDCTIWFTTTASLKINMTLASIHLTSDSFGRSDVKQACSSWIQVLMLDCVCRTSKTWQEQLFTKKFWSPARGFAPNRLLVLPSVYMPLAFTNSFKAC